MDWRKRIVACARVAVVPLAGLIISTGCTTNQITSADLGSLDRGHRIFVQRGLQIGALAITPPKGYHLPSPKEPAYYKLWDQAGFTTISLGTASPVSYPNTDFGDRPWNTWLFNKNQPENSLPKGVEPYLKSLVSWNFSDEQRIGRKNEFEAICRWTAHYKPLLPNTLFWTNQNGDDRFPFAGSKDKVLRKLIGTAHVDMLHFDTYDFGVNKDSNKVGRPVIFYYVLGRYRRVALGGADGSGKSPVPYGVWVQTVKNHGELKRIPSDSEIRHQYFAALTYGYKQIYAFTYLGGGVNNFFDKEGKPTASFRNLAETNRQARNLGPTLTRLISSDIRIVPRKSVAADYYLRACYVYRMIPEEWQPGLDPYIKEIKVHSLSDCFGGRRGDVLVGYFKPLLEAFDGDKYQNQTYFMITNGLSEATSLPEQTRQMVTVIFDFSDSNVKSLQRLNRLTGKVDTIRDGWRETTGDHISTYKSLGNNKFRLNLILDGGTGDLFKFDTGAPFIGAQ